MIPPQKQKQLTRDHDGVFPVVKVDRDGEGVRMVPAVMRRTRTAQSCCWRYPRGWSDSTGRRHPPAECRRDSRGGNCRGSPPPLHGGCRCPCGTWGRGSSRAAPRGAAEHSPSGSFHKRSADTAELWGGAVTPDRSCTTRIPPAVSLWGNLNAFGARPWLAILKLKWGEKKRCVTINSSAMQCTIFFKDLTWSLPFALEPASIQIFNINFLRAHALMEGKSSSDETRQCVQSAVALV